MRFRKAMLSSLPALALTIAADSQSTTLKSQPKCKSDTLQLEPRASCNPEDPTEVAGLGDRAFATLLQDPGILVSSDFCVLDPGATGPRADLIRFFRDTYFPLMKKLSPNPCDHIDAGSLPNSCISTCGLLARIQKLIDDPCERIDEVKSKADALESFRFVLKLASKLPYIKGVAKTLAKVVTPIESKLDVLVKKLDPNGNRCSDTREKAKFFREKLQKKLFDIAETVDSFNGKMATRLDYMCMQVNFEHSIFNDGRRSRNLRDMTTLSSLHGGVTTHEGKRRLNDRFLKFNEANVDTQSLLNCMPDLQELINDVNRIIQEIECFVAHVEEKVEAFLSVFQTSFGFLFDGPFDKLLDILGQLSFIVDQVKFLQCPSFLGPVCDLDKIIIDFLESLLAKIGFDINAIINLVLKGLGIDFPNLDIFFIDFPFPEIDFNFIDFDLFSLPALDSLFDRLIPQIGDILPCLNNDPLDSAFTNPDVLDNTDGEINGVKVEYRFAKGDLSSVFVECPATDNRFPFALAASHVDACGRVDVLAQTRRPCKVGETSCSIPIDILREGRDCSKKEGNLDQAGFGFRKDLVEESTVFYTCIDASSIGKIDALPDVSRLSYSGTDKPTQFFCTGDMQVEPLGFEQRESVTSDFFGGYGFKFGNLWDKKLLPERGNFMLQANLIDRFAANCKPGQNSCPTGFGRSPRGMIYLEERHDRKRSTQCREDFVTQAIPVDSAMSRCLIPGRDITETDVDTRRMVNTYHRTNGAKIYNYDKVEKCGALNDKDMICGKANECTRSTLYLRWVENLNQPSKVNRYTPAKSLPTGSVELSCPAGRKIKIEEFVVASVDGNGKVLKANRDLVPICCKTLISGKCDQISCESTTVSEVLFRRPGVNKASRLTYDCVCDDGHLLHEDENGNCIPCGKGSYRRGLDMTHCEACPAGTYADVEGLAQCKLAPIGTFVEHKKQSGYEFCPVGLTTPATGATSIDECVKCQEGHVAKQSGAAQICQPCPTNYWPNAAQTKCIPYHGIGSYTQNGEVVQCKAGEFRNEGTQTACSKCPVGSYNRALGKAGCTACSIGYYADVEGLTACTSCPAGTTTLNFGATRASQCITRPVVDYTAPEFESYTCSELLAYIDPDEPTGFNVNITLRESMLGNGLCDRGPWNTAQCGWDAGDCCRESCVLPDPDALGSSDFACTHTTFDCRDPLYQASSEASLVAPGMWWTEDEEICREDELPSTTEWSVAAVAKARGDGVCDNQLNLAEYDFDGGDCCINTCQYNPTYPVQSCLTNCHCLDSV